MSNDATGIGFCLNTAMIPTESTDSNLCSSALDTGRRLKVIRDACGFSQRELAKRAGVTNSSISMIEQGQVSPSIQSLSRILAAVPIGLVDFFGFQLFADPVVSSDIPILNTHQQLDARIQHLPPGHSTVFSASVSDFCGVVLNGNLQLTRLSGAQLLSQCDNFYITANQLFRFINLSENDASLYCCSLFAHKR